MAYLSKNHPLAFAGTLSPWARSAVNWAFTKLVESRSRVPFLCQHPNGKPCLIVPEISAECVHLTFLYGVHRSALAPNRLATFDVDGAALATEWRTLARAFVMVEMRPALVGVDHNSTVRAANELLNPYFPYAPSLSDFDSALGTTLEWSTKVQQEFVYASASICR